MQLDPEGLARRDRYALMISALIPRPIAWVSSVNAEGGRNLAPFSYFGGISSSPPLVGISIGRRRGAKKDTLRNLEETREGVIHIPTEALAEQMVLSSGDFPEDADEFELAGLDPVPSVRVRAPRIAAAPLAMEFLVERILELGDEEDRNGLVIARIVLFHIDDDLLEDGRIRPEGLAAIGRLGGQSYCRVREILTIPRPTPEEALRLYRNKSASAAAPRAEGSNPASVERGGAGDR